MHQPWVRAVFLQERLDAVFLAKVLLACECNGEPMLLREFLGVLTNLLAQGSGKLGVFESPNAVLI
jgi:hypothetical protein